MKKIHWLRVLKALALLLPIAAVVLLSQEYLFFHSDYNTERIHDFYNEEPHSLDVVVVGASEIYNGFSPIHAYEEYGYTSFLYSSPSNPAQLYMYELQEIIEHQSPQLIVFEMQPFHVEDGYIQEHDLRMLLEHTPMSLRKIQTILRDTVVEDKLSMVLPFIKYHGDWNHGFKHMADKLETRLAFRTEPCVFKGETTQSFIDMVVPETDWYDDYTERDLQPLHHQHLIDFLEYCRKNQLDNVVFVRYPHKVVSTRHLQRFERANLATRIVESYGFTVLDFEHNPEDYGLDMGVDFYDPEHLNSFGRQTLTEVLSEALIEEFGLEPREQSEENRARWEKSVIYKEVKERIVLDHINHDNNIRVDETPTLLEIIEGRLADN